MQRSLIAAAMAAVVIALAAPASAQVSPYVGLGLGPAIQIDNMPNQVRVEQEIGLTFGGRDGFFLAFAPYQSWSRGWWVLDFDARLGGTADLYHSRDVRFQLGGSGTVGFAISDDFNGRASDADFWFHLSGGLLLRVIILDDRLAIYLRPVTFEFFIGDSPRGGWGNEAIRYVAAGGVQYYF